MTDEIKPDPAEGEEITLNKAEYEQIVKNAEASEAAKVNLVSEIKELREKKQLSDTEKDDLAKKLAAQLPPATPTDDVMTTEKIGSVISDAINKEFEQRHVQNVSDAKENAIRKFKETHKEFDDSNDEGGIKFAAFERKLASFNLTAVADESGFQRVFADAYTLLGNNDKPTDSNPNNPYAATPSNEGNDNPGSITDEQLSAKELKLVETTFGGDKKRYLDQKTKRPDYVARLLNFNY